MDNFSFICYETCVELLNINTGEIITKKIPAINNKIAYDTIERKINSDDLMSSTYVLTGQVYRRDRIDSDTIFELVSNFKFFTENFKRGLDAFSRTFNKRPRKF